MAIKDVLVGLTSYPEPTAVSVVDSAVSIAESLGAHVAALACEIHVEVPGHFFSGAVAGLPGILAGEAAKSRQNASELLAAFEVAAQRAGVSYETILQKCQSSAVPETLVEYARLRDLTILSVRDSGDRWYAEAVIFGSGRPTLIVPSGENARRFELRTVVVAWDFSRAAARAISDALPLLERAKQVRVVTVINEKSFDHRHSAEELSRNLSRHGIDIVLDKVDAKGRAIGAVLETHALSCKADLLVMGAYGHSRLREFVLGGATRDLMSKPPLPILFSH
jgi:nucleotide-binding universal stress UspA family protein